MTGLPQILDGLADHLRHLREEGEQTLEVAPATLRALTAAAPPRATGPRTPPAANPLPPPSKPAPQSPRPAAPATAAVPPPPPAVAPAGSAAQAAAPPYARFGTTPELDTIASAVAACTRCGLCRQRTQTVPGQGHPHPELVFVGEGPGADEDAQGLAFVGRAGALLSRLITAMGLAREDVWIGNIVKCRPPDNRKPLPDEMQACLPYLRAQLALLKPKVIVALGATALTGLVDVSTGISRLRGTWLRFEDIDLMPTFHPSYLLRAGGESHARYWDVWSDMEKVLTRLGRPVPAPKTRKPAS